MKNTIPIAAFALIVSACAQIVIGSEIQRWVGTYEYEGTAYRVALVLVEHPDRAAPYAREYHLVPADTTEYSGNGAISTCVASTFAEGPLPDIRTCEQYFARDIDRLTRPPTMEGGGY